SPNPHRRESSRSSRPALFRTTVCSLFHHGAPHPDSGEGLNNAWVAWGLESEGYGGASRAHTFRAAAVSRFQRRGAKITASHSQNHADGLAAYASSPLAHAAGSRAGGRQPARRAGFARFHKAI